VQAIAHSMSLPADTLEDDVEPFLLRSGLIQRTPRGRMVTEAAYLHLGRQPLIRTSQRVSARLF
jgi:Holliday junction DNA helicase RuvB